MRRILLLVILVISFLSSCQEEEVVFDPEKKRQLQKYFPLEIGTYRIYGVTETEYTNNVGQTTKFQLRERIDAIVKDQTGKDWYRAEVSQRSYGTTNWTITGVKLLSLSSTDLQIKENNRLVVYLVNPVENGKVWVHNAYNHEPPTEYSYEKVGEPFVKDGKTSQNTLTLVKVKGDRGNLIEFEDRYDVLELGLGPVYRSSQVYSYCNVTGPNAPCQIGTGYIMMGTDRFEVLEEIGKM